MEVKKTIAPAFERRKQSTDSRLSESRKLKPADAKALNEQLLVLLKAMAGMNDPELSAPKQNKTYKQEDVVAAVELFFGAILSDEHCSKPMIKLVGLLKGPVLLSVEKTDRFLTDQRHPARRLLKSLFVTANSVELVSAAPPNVRQHWTETDQQGHAIYNALLAIVDGVAKDYKGDDRLFLQAYFDVCQIQLPV